MVANENVNAENRNRNRRNRSRRRNYESRPIEAAAVSYSNRQSFPNKVTKSRRITNSEFVATINGSTTFNSNQKFSINPGLQASFPWLSVMATQWQQYRFHKLRYRFVTRSSTSNVGSIVLSPDYNPKETAPSNDREASNTQDAVEDVIWKTLVCTLDPSAMFPFGPRKQLRSANVAGDTSLYDAGRLFVCVNGESSTAEIGRLWVDYDVELFVPQNSPPSYLDPSSTSLYTISGGAQTLATGVAEVVFFDSTGVYDPLGVGNCSFGIFTPPAGCYYVTVFMSYRDSLSEANTFTTRLLVDGAVGLPYAYDVSAAAGAVTFKSQTFSWIAPCSGTTTISISATMTGATGTLQVYGSSLTLIYFRLA